MKRLLFLMLSTLCAASFAQVPDYVPTDGLVGWWSMDGNAVDESGNGHDGDSSGPVPVEDRYGNDSGALEFDDGDFISLPTLTEHIPALSVAFWLKLDDYASGESPVGYNHFINKWTDGSDDIAFVMSANTTGLYLYSGSTPYQSDVLPSLGEWQHVAFVIAPPYAAIYLDGTVVQTFENVNAMGQVPEQFMQIGGNGNIPGYNSVDGSMDEVGLWNRALTPEEIQALYDTEPIEQTSQYVPDSVLVSEGWSLVLEREGHQYWLFDEDREWEDARMMCEELGAYLYWPNSMEEHQAVWESVVRGDDNVQYWTAIHQDFGVVDCSNANGGWAGPNGEPQTFFLWQENEPTNGGNGRESVVQFEWSDDGALWNDAPGQACDDGNNCSCRFSRVILERANDQGCTDAAACNYNESASLDDGSCDYSCCPGPGCCHAGTFWDVALQQCVVAEPAYLNEPGEAAILNPCYFDSDDDGLVDVNDLMNLLTVYNLACGDAPEATASWQCGDPLEYQGYDYATVQIGTQCWFAENARYMPEVAPAAQAKSTPEAPLAFVYGYQGTDTLSAQAEENYQIFGALYNFEAVSSWNLCPSGWHVPSDEDWFVLDEFIGLPFDDVVVVGWRGTQEGASLKSEYAWDGTDDWGFNALPGGRVNLRQWSSEASYFGDIGQLAHFWTSGSVVAPEIDGWGEIQAFNRYLNGDEDRYGRGDYALGFGMSVRCVKDSE